MGAADFRVGGHIFATLASVKQGYGNLMLTQDSGRLHSRPARPLPPHRRRLGPFRHDSHPPRPRHRRHPHRSPPICLETPRRKEPQALPQEAAPLTPLTCSRPRHKSPKNLHSLTERLIPASSINPRKFRTPSRKETTHGPTLRSPLSSTPLTSAKQKIFTANSSAGSLTTWYGPRRTYSTFKPTAPAAA